MDTPSPTPDAATSPADALACEYPPTEMHAKRRPFFLARVAAVADQSSCWLWTGIKGTGGYGKFAVGKRSTGPAGQRRRVKVTMGAHRVSWEIANGRPVPAGLCILHSCDVPACVRPSHLRPGTDRDNVHDALARGRHVAGMTNKPRGEGHYKSKLTDRDAAAIFAADKRIEHRALARRYGIDERTISRIRGGKAWRHIGDGGIQ